MNFTSENTLCLPITATFLQAILKMQAIQVFRLKSISPTYPRRIPQLHFNTRRHYVTARQKTLLNLSISEVSDFQLSD